MSPKLEKRFVLAACLVHIYKLDHTPKFDFSVSCISLSPCLMVHNTSSTNEESVEMYALSLPMDYRDELKNGFQVERIICQIEKVEARVISHSRKKFQQT